MKKILITGANSYIGTKFEAYLGKWTDKYQVETIDMIDGSWRNKCFKGYDVIYHVAGIAHSDNGKKISKDKEKLYRSVNTDLTIEVAKKAKDEGVKQFIFMSSAIVYGESRKIGKPNIITRDTPANPANCYGDSKLQAENGIKPLECPTFKVVILRPPMVYGKNSKGNFLMLEKYAKKLPFFPYVKNARSMIYVYNLIAFVKLMIDNEENGTFWPQNKEYANTSELVRMIGRYNNHKVRLVKGCTWMLRFMGLFSSLPGKAFGNLTYDHSISDYKNDYQTYSLEKSIEEAES